MEHNHNSDEHIETRDMDLFLDLVEANILSPGASVSRTLEMLDNLGQKACIEISGNIASLPGPLATQYGHKVIKELKWNKDLLSDLVFILRDLKDDRREFLPEDLDPELLKLLTPDMTPRQRKDQLALCLATMRPMFDIIIQVLEHCEKQLLLATQVELLSQEKEEYISVFLERTFQQQYLVLLQYLKEPEDVELNRDSADIYPFLLNRFHKNLKIEIDNNFYNLAEADTRPYLEQLKELFRQYLVLAHIKKPSSSLAAYRAITIEQLEDLAGQVEQLLELQALEPYLQPLEELVSKSDPFTSLLLFRHTGDLSLFQENEEGIEPKALIKLANMFEISVPQVKVYLEKVSRPLCDWSEQEQALLKKIGEYWERSNGIKEYDFSMEEA